MTTITTVNANEKNLIVLAEGEVVTIEGDADTAGVVYKLTDTSGTNSDQSWAVDVSSSQVLGPFTGVKYLLLTCSAGVVTATKTVIMSDVGFVNPMTTAEDLVKGGAAGSATRLAKGTDGQVLKMVSGAVEWAAEAADVGFANPMTTAGDIILAGADGVPTRLAIGTEGQVLKMVSGVPTWTTP